MSASDPKLVARARFCAQTIRTEFLVNVKPELLDDLASALEAAEARIAALEADLDQVRKLADTFVTIAREKEEQSFLLGHTNSGLIAQVSALEAENGALREKVERAAEDERDRLYRKANADYIEAEDRGDVIAQEWHSAAAGWLGHNGGKSEDDRSIARAALRQAEEKFDG